MKLLLIEDEEDLVKALRLGLKKQGYVVDVALDGRDGLDLYRINQYDLIILDLNLPSMDGLEILNHIREQDEATKVIILSARGEFEQRIEGLDKGANDYLVKPFHFGELLARIRSLLRRNFIQNNVILMCDDFYINTAKRAAFTHEDEKIELAPKEFAILEYLLLNKQRAVTSEELMEHVWESDVDMFSNAVKVHMSTLRKKLKELTSKDYIVHVRGAGYMMKGEWDE